MRHRTRGHGEDAKIRRVNRDSFDRFVALAVREGRRNDDGGRHVPVDHCFQIAGASDRPDREPFLDDRLEGIAPLIARGKDENAGQYLFTLRHGTLQSPDRHAGSIRNPQAP